MAPSELSFTVNMSTFSNDDPKTAATLRIRMKHWYQVHLQTYNEEDDTDHALTLFDEECCDEVISDPFIMPPPVITLLPLRRLCVLNALASMNIDGSLCECLGPKIEKHVFRAAETFGHKGFSVVAEIEVTKAYVYDHKTYITVPKDRYIGTLPHQS